MDNVAEVMLPAYRNSRRSHVSRSAQQSLIPLFAEWSLLFAESRSEISLVQSLF